MSDLNNRMFDAARAGNIELVKSLINEGANDFYKGTKSAVESGNIDLVKFLLEKLNTNGKVWAILHPCQKCGVDHCQIVQTKVRGVIHSQIATTCDRRWDPQNSRKRWWVGFSGGIHPYD